MYLNKLKQSTINTLFNIIDVMFLPIAMVVATPIFINNLGIEGYGKWMLINSLLIVMSVFNIGASDTLIRYVALYRSEGNSTRIKEIFSTVACVQISLCVIFLLVSISVPFLISNINYLNTNVNVGVRDALQFGVLIFSLKILEQFFLAYFKSYERYDLSALLSMLSKAVVVCTQLLTVINGRGIHEIFQNTFYAIIPVLIIQFIAIKVHNKDIRLFKYFKFERVKEIFNFTKWSWLTSMVITFGGQLDRWIVAALTDMKVLGIYSLVLLVFNNIHFITSSSVSWIYPKAAKQNNTSLIGSYYLKLQGFILVGSVILSSILYNFDSLFLFWLGDTTYQESIKYIKILLLCLPLYSLSIVPYYLLKAKGLIVYNFRADFFALIIKSVLIFTLYYLYYVEGVLYAIFLTGLFLSMYLTNRFYVFVLHEKSIRSLVGVMIPLSYVMIFVSEQLYLKGFFVCLMLYLFKLVFYKDVYKLLKYKNFNC